MFLLATSSIHLCQSICATSATNANLVCWFRRTSGIMLGKNEFWQLSLGDLAKMSYWFISQLRGFYVIRRRVAKRRRDDLRTWPGAMKSDLRQSTVNDDGLIPV